MREFVNLDIFNLMGKRIENTLNKHLSAGSHSIPLIMKNITGEMLLIRLAIGSHVSVYKYIPTVSPTVYSTRTMKQVYSPRANFSQTCDIVRISDPGYINSFFSSFNYKRSC
ncbi:MAG: hypothetical protein PVI26_03775 [Chitinispirillia bacterium]